ncbi:hypothetical protein QBC34DRAFT_432676 [Podospora aff. communis PSN243]|uniref:G domain-containing protein n=1 Tax=Podospora aff. communis PSN243 TaxID=3040156 RepID=A0AAV9H6H0_9PEZI|nr:hypothetical protein QBC34DRAFT_432676 [Podospora aff. communis PSN243]
MAGWKTVDTHEVKPPQHSMTTDGVMPQDMDKLPDEAQAPHVGPDDTVIAVMGMTGAGKSTFISPIAPPNAVTPAVGERRERELRENTRFWKELVLGGSQVCRQDNGITSATAIINHILSKQKKVTLKIQVEMASGASLGDTEAGREVNSELRKLEEKHKKDLETLRQDMAKALQEKDEESRILLEEMRSELTAEMKKVEEDKNKLQLDMHELRRQRAEEIAKEREEAHKRELEHQKAHEGWRQRVEEEMTRAHEQELVHQRAMADRNIKLQIQLAENKHQEELIKARYREQELERDAAEWRRRAEENSGGGCAIM